jgi:hypothetical protein
MKAQSVSEQLCRCNACPRAAEAKQLMPQDEVLPQPHRCFQPFSNSAIQVWLFVNCHGLLLTEQSNLCGYAGWWLPVTASEHDQNSSATRDTSNQPDAQTRAMLPITQSQEFRLTQPRYPTKTTTSAAVRSEIKENCEQKTVVTEIHQTVFRIKAN